MKHFRSERSGSIGIPMALVLLVLLSSIGVAVDFGRATLAKSKLQQTADASALAAAAASNNQRQVAADFFNHRTANDAVIAGATSDVTTNHGKVRVKGAVDVPTTFMKLAGYTDLSVNVEAVASKVVKPIELVIALDATNSMSGQISKAEAYEAVRTVANEVIDSAAQPGDAVVTLLPFSDRVNVGLHNENWLAGSRPGNWIGCVEPREGQIGSFAYALDDENASASPFNYSVPGVGALAQKGHGYPWCVEPFAGPTTDKSSIESLLGSISNKGTGRFDVAMAWGWRLLSPRWSGQFSVAGYPSTYGDKRKVLIVVTDFKSSAFGYEVRPSPDTSSRSNPPFDETPIGRDHLMDLCHRINATGIELWLIGVTEKRENIPYFQQCAGSKYLSANDLDEFKKSLEAAAGLNAVKLSH